MTPAEPTWIDDVAPLFAAPYWIVDPAKRQTVATTWLKCMTAFGVPLDQYDAVRANAVTVYEHLASRSMPLSPDAEEMWPDAALETVRTWVNQGCRQSASDPIGGGEIIPPPQQPQPRRLRVRPDILSLDQAELDAYRARLEDIGATTVDRNALWQRVAYIHTDWCLHYQEAFLLWHRANTLYFETLIGMPIPYWNFMAPDAVAEGLPQAFRDETYVHPRTGETRPNPLRYSVAKDGRSKAGTAPWVERDPLLYAAGPDHQAKLAKVVGYQQQVAIALGLELFSTPEGTPGYPWANITSFDPPPPDSRYPYRTVSFDGAYEQPHDNFHGWIGPDMADNAYTAFDSVFWSYHANIDRLFEGWNRAHPAATFTANFPLRPYAGPAAATVDFVDPDPLTYTTIGDMAKDSRLIGYDYGEPVVAEVVHEQAPPVPGAAAGEGHLYVLFPDVRCLQETLLVDVFVGGEEVGRLTRLGMGVEDDKGRCVADGVTRVLDATDAAHAAGLRPGRPVDVRLVVTDPHSGRELAPEEYRDLPGFAPVTGWGTPVGAEPASPSSGCCGG